MRVEVKGLGEAVNHGHSGVGGAGFTPPARCTTPHVSKEQVTAAFLDAVHHLIASRDQVDELVDQAVRAELDTTDLHIEADQLFARNARVAQDQAVYQRRFDKLTSEHATLLEEYRRLLDQTSDLDNRQAAYRYYKEQLATLDPASIEFTPYLWHTLVDHAEVNVDATITFSSGMEGRRRSHSRSDHLSNNCDIVYRVLSAGVYVDLPVVRVCDVQRREWGFTESSNNEPVCKEI
ncbi:hypothetical protein [Schaalia odontolytica]|uniref:Uncharacterized protein n=1 Tax=Schaalia odontolytica TaxID=1660 RepID=A0A2X0U394_9ACTO|nr:hypothetical protein [Schaalia odontolytica]WMS26990.1 hypothetical protein RDV55_07835 [Schaalia odontolytica]SPT55636.1 Uncharacterised protein [Schaalia odontolytica]